MAIFATFQLTMAEAMDIDEPAVASTSKGTTNAKSYELPWVRNSIIT